MYTADGKNNQKEALLNQHAGLVKKMAYLLKSKLPASVEVDDLIQVGMMGLMDAVNRYEDTHGAIFETYAAQRIRGSMLDELRSADWLPRSLRKNMREVERSIQQLEQRLAHAPSETEIAKEMKLDIHAYHEMLGDCHGHQLVYYEDFHDAESGGDHFLDRHLRDNSGDPIQALLISNFKASLVNAIDVLPEREKLLMGLYYEQELNLKEIGVVMNVSESRVCQLHTQAVARLRSTMKEQLWTGVV